VIEKIGVVGCGFVGGAVMSGFKKRGYEVVGYDPGIWEDVSFLALKAADCIFVCVPTPELFNGSCDVSRVLSTLNKLSRLKYSGLVVIKSTVDPKSVRFLVEKFSDLRIATNPEFLTARNAQADFDKPTHIVIGVSNRDDAEVLFKLYHKNWPNTPTGVYSPEAAMMMKYMTNSWFATKVTLMNEFYLVWQALGYGDWESVVEAFSLDPRVGPTHLQVPGPDGKFGFGGACFPKDTAAMQQLQQKMGTSAEVLDAVLSVNEKIRGANPDEPGCGEKGRDEMDEQKDAAPEQPKDEAVPAADEAVTKNAAPTDENTTDAPADANAAPEAVEDKADAPGNGSVDGEGAAPVEESVEKADAPADDAAPVEESAPASDDAADAEKSE